MSFITFLSNGKPMANGNHKVALTIKSSLKRPDDYTFRLGGEEFGMLYNVSDTDDAFNIANKLREDIESLKIEHSKNSSSKFLTISIGVYIIESDNDYEISDIYKSTDDLLYKAKQEGRNQVAMLKP